MEGGVDKAGAAKGNGTSATGASEEPDNEFKADWSSSTGGAASRATSATKGRPSKGGGSKGPAKKEGHFQQLVWYMMIYRLFVWYYKLDRIIYFMDLSVRSLILLKNKGLR